MSLYGCELWLLSNTHIEELCVSWRKGLRRVWRLPYRTHCYLLPLLSQCLSLEDEICKRSLNCIRECLCNSSRLVTAIAYYGINYGRSNSVLGLNAMFCSSKFNVNISNICSSVANVIGVQLISTLKEGRGTPDAGGWLPSRVIECTRQSSSPLE